jgi:hypothetical protein
MSAKLAKKKNLIQETTVSNEIAHLIAQYIPDNIDRAIEEKINVCSKLEKQYMVKRVLTSSDIENFPAYGEMGYKVGDKIEENPVVPTQPGKAFELLKNFYAILKFEEQKVRIIHRAGSLKEPVIKAEIKVIEDFVTEAEKLNYRECFTAPARYGYYTLLNETSEHHEYLRLKNGFYDDIAITPEQFRVHSTPAKVYGRYFLLYEYLKELLSYSLPPQPEDQDMTFGSITVADRVLKELDIIEQIFKAQFAEKSTENLPYPEIFAVGERDYVAGRYIASGNLCSDEELLNIIKFQEKIGERFERANDNTLVRNQLKRIYDKAIEVRDFYNEKLTKGNKIVDDFLDKKKNSVKEIIVETPLGDIATTAKMTTLEYHSAMVTIERYSISEIYLGVSNPGGCKFNYYFNNGLLAFICKKLIYFIEGFNILPTRQPKTGKENNGKKSQPSKVFSDYLNHEKKNKLADELKKEFSIEKGKGIKLMLKALEEFSPKILIRGSRDNTAIYKSLKTFFDRDIGSKNSILDFTYNEANHKEDFENIKIRVAAIVESLNK